MLKIKIKIIKINNNNFKRNKITESDKDYR